MNTSVREHKLRRLGSSMILCVRLLSHHALVNGVRYTYATRSTSFDKQFTLYNHAGGGSCCCNAMATWWTWTVPHP
ncbi:MAG: hypothetical protein IPH63_13015 [Flavobacteriales bacterium]|nr:hypothetical protein [Flavobacteriales bacterium]MBK7102690.1 hypothetical protein [Flavobacteriales bacterium]